MGKVAILLSTYNSEPYLSALIDSILAQSYNNWTLYIRDDGSTDSTNHIIKRYQEKHSNIHVLRDSILGQGAKNSFMWLLKAVESDYYMFCDHDDIWLEKKVENAYENIHALSLLNPSIPIIVHTDLIVVDSRLETISPSYWRYAGIDPKLKSFEFFSAYNNLTGCTMIINHCTKLLALNIPKSAAMHDSWLGLVVSFHKGIISYLNTPDILYRQHNTNVIGAQPRPTMLNRLFNIRSVLQANLQIFRTVNSLKKTSFLSFLLNKIMYKLKLMLNLNC